MIRAFQKTARKKSDGGQRPEGPLRLVVITPTEVVTRELPTAGRVTFGRSPEADVRVDDPELSRLHAALLLGPTLSLVDLGSSNGTRLDGRTLGPDETAALGVGRAFEIGGTLVIVQPAAPTAADGLVEETLRDVAPPESGMRARIVVADPAMTTLHQMIERVASGEISVLLLGETGVGKEVFAERIHQSSRRAKGPFLRLNCAALTESLLESELFGHERGAFTGAVAARVGLLESAAGGTVFLDEVGELSASVQVKLLRVLDERKVTPVGATRPRPIDVRVVSATHRDLESAITAGHFRLDLWFRLNGISLVVPPLRERAAEVEALARLFLSEACVRSKRDVPPHLSDAALVALRGWRWPGNLRELRNVMERAALLAAGDRIEIAHLPEALRAASVAPPASEEHELPAQAPPTEVATMRSAIEEMERQRMVAALVTCGGNQTRAAAMLGMPRRTFVFKVSRYGITRPRKPDGGLG